MSFLTRFCRLLAAIAFAVPVLASAQSADKPFSNEQLDQMTAQIALYPDSLLAQLLMATTYPEDFAAAAAWSKAHPDAKGDDAVKMVENEPWDPSVASLVAFPEVLITFGGQPDWVRNVGDAFLAQPDDVMNSVQRLRQKAQAAGNLKSNEQVKVSMQAPEPAPATATVVVQQSAPPPQVIVIEPAQPSVVFVPSFNPTVVYGPWPWVAYPPFFFPPPPGFWWSRPIATGIAWGVGIGVTNALWGGVRWGGGWGHNSVNINVNRYNNINVNRRLDVNNRTANWNHNPDRRGNTPYRGGDATRKNLENKRDAGNREQYRGKDASRDASREPRAAVDAGARRRRRFRLGPRPGAERRPRCAPSRRRRARTAMRPPSEGPEHRSRRGPAARAADLAGQRAQGRGRPAGQAAGRPRRGQPEGGATAPAVGVPHGRRRPAVAPRRPRRPAAALGRRCRRVAAAGAVGPARVVVAAVAVVVADDKRR